MSTSGRSAPGSATAPRDADRRPRASPRRRRPRGAAGASTKRPAVRRRVRCRSSSPGAGARGTRSRRTPKRDTVSHCPSWVPSAVHQMITTTPGATAPSDASRRNARSSARAATHPDDDRGEQDDAGGRADRHRVRAHDVPARTRRRSSTAPGGRDRRASPTQDPDDEREPPSRDDPAPRAAPAARGRARRRRAGRSAAATSGTTQRSPSSTRPKASATVTLSAPSAATTGRSRGSIGDALVCGDARFHAVRERLGRGDRRGRGTGVRVVGAPRRDRRRAPRSPERRDRVDERAGRARRSRRRPRRSRVESRAARRAPRGGRVRRLDDREAVEEQLERPGPGPAEHLAGAW